LLAAGIGSASIESIDETHAVGASYDVLVRLESSPDAPDGTQLMLSSAVFN